MLNPSAFQGSGGAALGAMLAVATLRFWPA
jgi:hypothetical protein